jgi:hypothetical protein
VPPDRCEMRRVRTLRHGPIFLAIALALGACEGVGIPATSDPYAKLSMADHHWRDSGRVWRARQQIDQAIVIFEQRGDKAGLAEAYREYALIARVGGANPDPVILFPDSKAVYAYKPSPDELNLSDGYLRRTIALATETRRFDLVTNADYLLGNNQVLRGEPQNACGYYDRARPLRAKPRANNLAWSSTCRRMCAASKTGLVARKPMLAVRRADRHHATGIIWAA